MEGEDDLDSALDRQPLSEIVSLALLDPPDNLLADLFSDGILNFLCNVSSILSLLTFFFASFDDDLPHHEGIIFDTSNRRMSG